MTFDKLIQILLGVVLLAYIFAWALLIFDWIHPNTVAPWIIVMCLLWLIYGLILVVLVTAKAYITEQPKLLAATLTILLRIRPWKIKICKCFVLAAC